jgi:hypothetical protein
MTKKRNQRDHDPGMADLFDLPILPHPAKASSYTATSSLTSSAAPTLTLAKPRKKRKPSKIFHSCMAKQDWTYDTEGVMALYRVTRNTVANWIREGLVTIPGHPVLFRGADLNAFHQARRSGARLNLPPGYFLCFHCKKVSSLKGETAEVHWRGEHTATLGWSCPACGKPNGTYQSRSQVQKLAELGVNLTSSDADYTPSRRPGENVQITPKSEVLDEPVE